MTIAKSPVVRGRSPPPPTDMGPLVLWLLYFLLPLGDPGSIHELLPIVSLLVNNGGHFISVDGLYQIPKTTSSVDSTTLIDWYSSFKRYSSVWLNILFIYIVWEFENFRPKETDSQWDLQKVLSSVKSLCLFPKRAMPFLLGALVTCQKCIKKTFLK